jgi:hypothetical protein
VRGLEAKFVSRPIENSVSISVGALEVEDRLRGAILGRQVFLVSSAGHHHVLGIGSRDPP